jgi:hypothetical protein
VNHVTVGRGSTREDEAMTTLRVSCRSAVLLALWSWASGAPAQGACSDAQAKEAAAAHAAVKAFCAANRLGCDYSARPPSPLNANERDDGALAWVVMASQIHSLDAQGKPRFMPEGAMFAHVSKTCAVTKLLGHGLE